MSPWRHSRGYVPCRPSQGVKVPAHKTASTDSLSRREIGHKRMGIKGRAGYPSNVSDEEWAFVLPCLLLSREDSAHREHDLRAVFNGVRYIARTGNQWRFMPHDHPLWPAIDIRQSCLLAVPAGVQPSKSANSRRRS